MIERVGVLVPAHDNQISCHSFLLIDHRPARGKYRSYPLRRVRSSAKASPAGAVRRASAKAGSRQGRIAA
ncbi:hypothetical protein EZV77_30315 [Burkholderia thailandensis]|nr:hypothetical protein A8H31_21970 [Burkholderia thailandensis]AVR26863.1 hypothetical protein A8H32_01255 [Burkholderia thailandensis]AWY60198.1 hypothetical protein A8H35_01265 [Burkholderia thailandensis]AWY69574.1 hypothetical protein A8H36_27105 [Burkholderia thailandensis]MDD1484399.1 hypothetical protein [Burkholderia thailandensis]